MGKDPKNRWFWPKWITNNQVILIEYIWLGQCCSSQLTGAAVVSAAWPCFVPSVCSVCYHLCLSLLALPSLCLLSSTLYPLSPHGALSVLRLLVHPPFLHTSSGYWLLSDTRQVGSIWCFTSNWANSKLTSNSTINQELIVWIVWKTVWFLSLCIILQVIHYLDKPGRKTAWVCQPSWHLWTS